MITGRYPNLRLRRNRKTDWARRLVAESSLSNNDLILPILAMGEVLGIRLKKWFFQKKFN